MLERIPVCGGPLTNAVIEADLDRNGIDVQSPKRYPCRIFMEYDAVRFEECIPNLPDAPFAIGRHSIVAEYEFNPETGYEFLQWTMKPEPAFQDPPRLEI